MTQVMLSVGSDAPTIWGQKGNDAMQKSNWGNDDLKKIHLIPHFLDDNCDF